jgi:hypothetical protein
MLSAGNAGHPPTVGPPATGVALGLGCGVAVAVAAGGGVEVGLGVEVAVGVIVRTGVAVRVGVRVAFTRAMRPLAAYGAAAAEAVPMPKIRQSIAPSTKSFDFMDDPRTSC